MDQEIDFWEFALEPANQKRMEVIVEGARLFVEEMERKLINNPTLTGPKKIVFAHVEPYPFDTFSVIVYFRVEEGISFSLNLEDIKFLNESFSATARVCAWREIEGYREFLIRAGDEVGARIFETGEVYLKPEEIFRLYLKMYDYLASEFSLYPLKDLGHYP